MTQQIVGPEEVGRICPYCRFPFKAGISAHRCDACGALHHEDCWQDGNGCAVFGCAGASTATSELAEPVTAVRAAVPIEPSFAPSTPGYPPPAGASPRARHRRTLAWVLGCLAIAGAGFGAYVLASQSKTVVETQTVTQAPTSGNTTSPGTGNTTSPGTSTTQPVNSPSPAQLAADHLNSILQYSLAGRSDAVSGNYQGAISNRQAVLSKLASMPTPDAAIAQAVATLRKAMNASLQADQAFASGNTNPVGPDNAATTYKQQFVSEWTPIAKSYNLPQYSAGEI